MLSFEQSPGQTHAAVTPSDVTVIAFRALYIGTGGAVAVVDNAGNAVTYLNVPAGFILPMAGKQVKATGTTASNIVAMQ